MPCTTTYCVYKAITSSLKGAEIARPAEVPHHLLLLLASCQCQVLGLQGTQSRRSTPQQRPQAICMPASDGHMQPATTFEQHLCTPQAAGTHHHCLPGLRAAMSGTHHGVRLLARHAPVDVNVAGLHSHQALQWLPDHDGAAAQGCPLALQQPQDRRGQPSTAAG